MHFLLLFSTFGLHFSGPSLWHSKWHLHRNGREGLVEWTRERTHPHWDVSCWSTKIPFNFDLIFFINLSNSTTKWRWKVLMNSGCQKARTCLAVAVTGLKAMERSGDLRGKEPWELQEQSTFVCSHGCHQILIVVWMPLSWLNVNYINLHEIRTYTWFSIFSWCA